MKVYLDMCSIQRPLDTKSQPRIAVEDTGQTKVVSPLELITEVTQ